MKTRIYNYIVLLFLIVSAVACQAQTELANKNATSTWPVASYNFGGMEKMSAKDQISILRKSGYEGIILRISKEENFEMLPEFISEADKYDDFKISSAFVRYNFKDPEKKRESWSGVVDQIAGKDIPLWVIFGKPVEGYGDDFIERKLREIVKYASQKNVEVVLYPHSTCVIESAEEGLPFVEKINHDKLKIAFHLYHEIRAKNGHRIDEVLDAIEHKLGAVTIAGTDSVADYTTARTLDTSTVKVLGQGTYDMEKFVQQLQETDYSGDVGIMNFKFEIPPEVYLPNSKIVWENYIGVK